MAQNPNIDDATRERAMKFVADKAAPAKQRVVSKKELQESGLSLRDFLNKERGLTRRKSDDPTAGEARDKAMPKAAPAPAPASKASPVDETKLSANERTKRSIEKNLSGARSGSGPTDTRSVNERIRSGLRSAFGMKNGGMTSSASKRADGIATKGKTRGKMC
jgi:hypothetical protein